MSGRYDSFPVAAVAVQSRDSRLIQSRCSRTQRCKNVDFTGADDVSSIASLKTATYKKVSKTQLWEYHHGSDETQGFYRVKVEYNCQQ